ncbi:MAG TPA: response regulator transcription factor [Acidimicrobiia bacterium]|nr:response regulator transcription factor [Acidimicrobiia bacterium]
MTTAAVRVLIVDDQEPFRSAARLVVSLTDGFEVTGEAATGESAVTMAKELSPDLILMDINLPGIDGLEATRQIVQAQPSAKVIVMSTYEPDEYEQRAIEAGAGAFMSKSDLDPDTLLAGWHRLS